MVIRIQNMNPSQAVAGHGPGVVHFAERPAVAAPTTELLPLPRELLHPVISIFAHQQVAIRIERNAVRIRQLARLRP